MLAVSSDNRRATFNYASRQNPGEQWDFEVEPRQPFSLETRVKCAAVEIGRISDDDLHGDASLRESLFDHLSSLRSGPPDEWLLEVLRRLYWLGFISTQVYKTWISRLTSTNKAKSTMAECESPREFTCGSLRVSIPRRRMLPNSEYRGPLDMASLAKHMPDLDPDDDDSPRAQMLRRMAEEAAKHGSPFASHRPKPN